MKQNFKMQTEIKRYVNEATKKMYYDIRNITNQIRSVSAQVHRLEKKQKEIEDGLKTNDS